MSIKTIIMAIYLSIFSISFLQAQIPIDPITVVQTNLITQSVIVSRTNSAVYTLATALNCKFDYSTGGWKFLIDLKTANSNNSKTVVVNITKEQIQTYIGKTWEESSTIEYFNATMALAIAAAKTEAVK
jgi:hypothetical protein